MASEVPGDKPVDKISEGPKRGPNRIPPTVDDMYANSPKWYKGKNKWRKFHGFRVMEGPGRMAFFSQTIQERMNAGRSCIILLTGHPGEGKTYSAIRLAQKIDPKFKILDNPPENPAEDTSQVAFSREHLLFLLGNNSPLKRGQVVLIDESQYAMGSRRWYEDIQKDLMETFEAIRSKGLIIMIVALHMDLLDVIIRKYVLSFMIYLERRGKGTVYQLQTPRFSSEMMKRKIGTVRLLLPGYEECKSPQCLTCRHLFGKPHCGNLRAIYERRKKVYVGSKTEGTMTKIADKRAKEKRMSDAELVECLYKHRNELKWTSKGNIEPVSQKLVLERELKYQCGVSKLNRLATELRIKHDDVAPPG